MFLTLAAGRIIDATLSPPRLTRSLLLNWYLFSACFDCPGFHGESYGGWLAPNFMYEASQFCLGIFFSFIFSKWLANYLLGSRKLLCAECSYRELKAWKTLTNTSDASMKAFFPIIGPGTQAFWRRILAKFALIGRWASQAIVESSHYKKQLRETALQSMHALQ